MASTDDNVWHMKYIDVDIQTRLPKLNPSGRAKFRCVLLASIPLVDEVGGMTKAVFTASELSAYDDLIEQHYHFPNTYLRQARAAVGDWIVYYEPRRNSGPSSNDGRQSYFAIARLQRIDPDPVSPRHFYARLSDYAEFERPVPFKTEDGYFESALLSADGSTNKGAFGRSVRNLSDAEFDDILAYGNSRSIEPWEVADAVADAVPEYAARPLIERLTIRKYRDEAFRRHVRTAYGNTCAVSGLCLINGGGRPEVQAAHIKPVECDGPDTVRNGLALTGTVHWMFDRGLISIGEDSRLLVSPHGVPEELGRLIRPDRSLLLPASEIARPHPTYLAWHREHRFKH